MHRVFPSSYFLIASSQLIQFRKNNIGDRKEVVTPFVQDVNYTSRNFATLGPSRLRPPFTETYFLRISFVSIGQVSDFIHHKKNLQNLMFLLNSRYLLFLVTYMPFFFRSYKVNLPSSFNIILSFVLIFSTVIPELVLLQYII